MLRIATVRPGGERYYYATVAATTDRPSGLVEADPVWLGAGAERLGLTGSVPYEAMRALAGGRDPVSGDELVDRRRYPVVNVAYDVTLSVPKSVSLLHGLASEPASQRLEQAHAKAVETTVGYLERTALRARRSEDGVGFELGVEGAVAVAFVHRTTRSDDPHLHTHVVVANLCRGVDGRWGAVSSRPLFAKARVARALFESQLRSELTKIGVELGSMRGLYADVAGISRDVVAEFSRRSRAIEEAMGRISGPPVPRTGRHVAEMTRPEKARDRSYEELRAEWRERGYKMGLSPSRIEAAAGVGHGVAPEVPPLGDLGPPARVRARSSMAHEATFTLDDVVVEACRRLPTGGAIEQVEARVAELVDSGVIERAQQGFTTAGARAALARTSERLGTLARTTGAEIAIYDSDRLGLLDDLARLAARASLEGRSVLGLAAGERSAAGFEALTGIETAPARHLSALEGHLRPGGLLVVADVAALSASELVAALELCEHTGARAVLFSRRGAVSSSPALEAIAAGAATAFEPAAPVVLEPAGSGTIAPRQFGPDATGAVAPDLERARSLALAIATSLAIPIEARGGRHGDVASGKEPRRVFLAAPDHAVVGALRNLAGPGVEVVHTAELGRALARHDAVGPSTPRPVAVVLGAAASLGLGQHLLGQLTRHHVVVSRREPPGGPDRADGPTPLGALAEAVRPTYLTTELGAPRAGLETRVAWRSAAGALEAYRDRFGLTGERSAYGRAASAERVEAREEVRRLVCDLGAARGIDTARRHDRDGPLRLSGLARRGGPERTLGREGPGR